MINNPIPKKSLGQHWLEDPATLEQIVSFADLEKTDTVLEVGPGLGYLTKILANKSNKVIAVEFDHALASKLAHRVKQDNLEVINKDILSFNFEILEPNYKIVANIPYYLTNNLLRIISETSNQALVAVLLMQKEVAERANAGPGNHSLLSVSLQFYWQVSLGPVVKADMFIPPPKVDSRVLILQRRQEQLFDVDSKAYFRIVKAGFSSKRKTLLNSLSAGLGISKDEVRHLLGKSNIDPGLRAQSLSLDDWHNIYSNHIKPRIN